MFDFSELNKTMELAKSKIQGLQSANPAVRNSTPFAISDIDKMMKFAVKGDTEKLKQITNKYTK